MSESSTRAERIVVAICCDPMLPNRLQLTLYTLVTFPNSERREAVGRSTDGVSGRLRSTQKQRSYYCQIRVFSAYLKRQTTPGATISMADENPLTAIRQGLGLTQAQMAEALELSPRAYQEQEAAEEPRHAYVLAARYLSENPARIRRRGPPKLEIATIPTLRPRHDADQLQELVDDPVETLATEYKSWLNLNDDGQRATLARHIAALANAGGGNIVFGFNDDLSVAGPNPYLDIDRDVVAALVKRYLEPSFQCDVRSLLSGRGTSHPVITVPPHGSTPICAKAGGPELKGKPVGIVKGTYYIRKPGPASEAILSPAEWLPLIRRCALHERSSILGAVSSALAAAPLDETPADLVAEWHEAANAAVLSKLDGIEPPVDLRKARQQFSYVIGLIGEQRLRSNRLSQVLSETNAEVRDLVMTGWSMFYQFSRDGIAPYWTTDAAIEGGDEDFLECSLLGEVSDRGGLDFWRVSPNGKATLIREFWEDHPMIEGRAPYTAIDPDLVGRSLAELVRHARGFASRFDLAVDVSFRCEWRGLAGRRPQRLHGGRGPFGRTTNSDHRVSTGTWPVGDLTGAWPNIVSTLAAPVARAFGLEDQFEPELLALQVDRWRRL
jgi:hypothetical protein